MNREITLAVETAVGSGSVSLLEKNNEIDFRIGNAEILRAEELLFSISELLYRNNLEKSDLKKIIYSHGPGSCTGIRIGLATVKGLKNALGCECFGQTVLESLTLKAVSDGIVQTAIETAKNQICRQFFDLKAGKFLKILSEPEIVANERFFSEADDSVTTVFLFKNRKIFDLKGQSENLLHEKIIYIGTGENIAYLIGKFSEKYSRKQNDLYV